MICLDMPGGAEASFAFTKPGGCVTLGGAARRMVQVKNEVSKTCEGKVQDQRNALSKEGQRGQMQQVSSPGPCGGAQEQVRERT